MSNDAPQITRAPCCAKCGRPFLLRYHTNVYRMSEMPLRARRRWMWIRDCDGECRRAQRQPLAKMKAIRVDAMPKRKPPTRPRKATP